MTSSRKAIPPAGSPTCGSRASNIWRQPVRQTSSAISRVAATPGTTTHSSWPGRCQGLQAGDVQHVEGQTAGRELRAHPRQHPPRRGGVVAAADVEAGCFALNASRNRGNRAAGTDVAKASTPSRLAPSTIADRSWAKGSPTLRRPRGRHQPAQHRPSVKTLIRFPLGRYHLDRVDRGGRCQGRGEPASVAGSASPHDRVAPAGPGQLTEGGVDEPSPPHALSRHPALLEDPRVGPILHVTDRPHAVDAPAAPSPSP